MDKKLMYGLGAVALIGAFMYFKNKQGEATADAGADAGADSGADAGGGAGGGGGASAPSPTDVAMGQMAKEDVKKSMDLGGLDMASKKVEKGAMATGMVASMVASGKQVPPSVAKAVVSSKIPASTKSTIVNKVVATKPTLVQQVKGVASKPASVVKSAVVSKPVVQVNKVVAKTLATPSKPVSKAVVTVSKSVAPMKGNSVKANPMTKFKKFDGNYGFDGEDMFANAVSTNKQCHYENEIVGYSSTGQPIVQQKLVCNSIGATAKFDGDYEMSNFSGASDF